MSDHTVVRTAAFEILTSKIGAFLVVRLRGRCTDDLLGPLRHSIFSQKTSFAIDMSGLSNISMPLAREIYFTAQNLKATEHRLILLSPPEKFLSLMSLLTSVPLPTLYAESQLSMDPTETDQRAAQLEREIARIKAEIQNNKFWQYIDRDGGWLCPYCGKLQEDVRIASRVNLTPAALEKIYRHLWFGCALFKPVGPKYLPAPDLEAKIRAVNADKLLSSKKSVEMMESKFAHLEQKAKKADALEQSLSVASARQRRLLPDKAPDIPGTEIGILYRPAEQVSGDFYDFIPLPDGRLGFAIGDVAGHGIEAAILMGMSKKVLALRLEELGDPVEVVKRANNDLYRELDRQLFVTAFVGVLDPVGCTFTYARAGHNPPLLYNATRSPSLQKLETGGLGLGMSKGPIFERVLQGDRIDLQSGDLLLFYTDGLVEARNKDGEEFQLERVAKILEESADKPCDFLLGVLGFEMDKFSVGLPQEDDVTAVCLKIK